MHIGPRRGVILGDSISRLPRFTGHKTQREYYSTTRTPRRGDLGRGLGAHAWRRTTGGCYVGEYVTELAEIAKRELGDIDIATAGAG